MVVSGTDVFEHVDPRDGLLSQGAEGYQLTWMDAKVGDWVVTPRRGKAVEINGLWYNALCLLEQWIRDELAPWITPDLDAELRTFSKRETRPSPRALPGCNDDRVMSAGVSLELYRLYGHHERKRRPKHTRGRWKKSRYPWEVG